MGRYELIRPLARGGMAEVFLARRRGPGGVVKRLVLKRVRRERADDPRYLSMFVDEARISMSLAHKNIVPMFDFGRAGDEMFLVMEYIDGVDLGRALRRAANESGPLSPQMVAYIGIEACHGLSYAHKAGLIHRDVTPRNVLVSRAGEIKLVDFGVAVSRAELTEELVVRGTPGYMSPEQARGEPIDGRSDVYSLGLVLWEALAGRRAFTDTDPRILIDRARAGIVAELPPTVPPKLARVVATATHRSLAERFADAHGMRLALDEYLVSARAASAGGSPPSDTLSGWIAAAFPAEFDTGDPVSDPALPDGDVVTFLDDAGASMRRFTALVGGNSTLYSAAETRPETAAGDADEDTAAAPRHPRGRAAAWLVALALAGASAAGATAWVGAVGTTDSAVAVAPTPSLDAGPDAALPAADAAPAVDAARPAQALAPPPRPARPRRVAAPAAGAPRASARPGTIRVGAEPWARVSVEGSKETCSQTPCILTLPAGRYELVLENRFEGLGARRAVEVTSDTETRVRFVLTDPL